MGWGTQIAHQDMQGSFVINLPDNPVGLVNNGVGQTVAVAKFALSPIGQRAHRCWDSQADGTNLPEARRSLSMRRSMLAS